MTTQAVLYTVPSPAWTGAVDVTLANLLPDVTVKDFTLLYDGVEQGTVEKALWTKTSYAQLTYSGSALGTGNVVTIRRKTPNSVIQSVTPQSIILSSLWNNEFDRQIRWREEADTFYNVNVPVTGHIVDTAFSSAWNGVTGDSPSKNVVYDLFNSTTASITPSWTFASGATLTAATGSTVTFGSGSSVVFNSAAPVTGTVDMDAATSVLVPTVAKAAKVSDTTTQATNQKWVVDNYHSLQPGGRLCLESGKPTPTYGSVTSSTLYYTPFKSNTVWLYNTTDTEWRRWEFTEISITVAGLTNEKPYDVFIYNNSGNLALELVIWTNYSTRATALTWLDGMPVKTGNNDRLYLGTITTSVADTLAIDTGCFSVDYKVGACGVQNFFNTITGAFSNTSASVHQISNTEEVAKAGKWLGCLTGYNGLPTGSFNTYGYGSNTVNFVVRLRDTFPSSLLTGSALSSMVVVVYTSIYGGATCASTTLAGAGFRGFTASIQASTAVYINDIIGTLTVSFSF